MVMSNTLMRPKAGGPPASAGKSLLAESGSQIKSESGATIMTEQ